MRLLFVHPTWLLALLSLPLLALLLWQRSEATRQAARAFAHPVALARWGLGAWTARTHQRAALSVLGLGALLLALAEPRLGRASPPQGQPPGQSGTLVVALDLSRSMRAEDMGQQARLRAATELASAVVEAMGAWRVAVVGFAGEAQGLIPPTTDHEAVATLLAAAAPGQVAGAGSNLERGLDAAAQLLRRPGPRALLLLSDGEALAGEAGRALPQLKALGPAVAVVGVGSPAGARIPLPSVEFGVPEFVKHEGQPVISRLEEGALQAIAQGSGGRYWRLLDGLSAQALAEQLGQGGAAAQGGLPAQGWPLFWLALALALLAWGGELALAWWPRRPGLGRLALLLLVVAGSPALKAEADPRAWWTERQARAQLANQPEAGLEAYRRATAAFPMAWELHHNAGVAAFQTGHFGEAANAFRRAHDMAPPSAQPAVAYQLGNALFRQAETEDAPEHYRHAIAEYERCLAAQPGDADAQHNLALAKARLKAAERQAAAAPPPTAPGQGGQGGGGGQFGGPQFAVGANTHYEAPKAPPALPSAQEVAQQLARLEADERQRQAEAGEAAAERASQARAGGLGGALRSLTQERDW